MKFWRRNWYYIGGVLFVALSFFMGFLGSILSRIQVILNFMLYGHADAPIRRICPPRRISIDH